MTYYHVYESVGMLSLRLYTLICTQKRDPPGKGQGVQAPTASKAAVFLGSAADLHLQYLSLSQIEAAGRPPGCYSSRGKPRAECTPRADVRGAEEPSAPAMSAPTSDHSVADWSPVDDELVPTPIVSDGREPLPLDSTGVEAQKESADHQCRVQPGQ
eukprot:4040567-Pleurochrysis_carterae.AAC.1